MNQMEKDDFRQYKLRGILNYELKKFDEAEKDFLKALEYQDENPELIYWIGISKYRLRNF